MQKKLQSIIILFILLFTVPYSSSGQNDNTIIASLFDNETLDLNDGLVDPAWDNISYYANLQELGDQGFVKFSNNISHIFALFKISSTKNWVAVEFGAYEEFCMARGNDGWSFYIDQENGDLTAFDDIYQGSAGIPDHDTIDDLKVEAIQNGDYYLVEVVRPFQTNDASDIEFANDDLWQMKFASSTHHATGGAVEFPTEFGPSDIYFLSVQIGSDIYIPDVPETIDYQFWKLVIFIGTFFAFSIFITTHFLVRQKFRPLSHPNPIVNKDYIPPTLQSRWNETFGNSNSNKISDRKQNNTSTEAS